jgi:hypothetical protein
MAVKFCNNGVGKRLTRTPQDGGSRESVGRGGVNLQNTKICDFCLTDRRQDSGFLLWDLGVTLPIIMGAPIIDWRGPPVLFSKLLPRNYLVPKISRELESRNIDWMFATRSVFFISTSSTFRKKTVTFGRWVHRKTPKRQFWMMKAEANVFTPITLYLPKITLPPFRNTLYVVPCRCTTLRALETSLGKYR